MMANYTIDNAIEEIQGFAKETTMFVGSPKAAKIAEWLQELAGFKDETPITTEFLNKNFSFVDSDDSDGIWAALYDNDPYYAKIQIDTDCHNEGFKVIWQKSTFKTSYLAN